MANRASLEEVLANSVFVGEVTRELLEHDHINKDSFYTCTRSIIYGGKCWTLKYVDAYYKFSDNNYKLIEVPKFGSVKVNRPSLKEVLTSSVFMSEGEPTREEHDHDHLDKDMFYTFSRRIIYGGKCWTIKYLGANDGVPGNNNYYELFEVPHYSPSCYNGD